jgi:hypothetical protein
MHRGTEACSVSPEPMCGIAGETFGTADEDGATAQRTGAYGADGFKHP